MPNAALYKKRFYFLIAALLLGVVGLIWRMLDLGIIERNFLRKQNNARVLRVIDIPAHRGMITDRNGKPLAISTPVDSVWANPQMFSASKQQLYQLAKALNLSASSLKRKMRQKSAREFIYLKRRIPPSQAAEVANLAIPGVFLQHEYRRYYPDGAVAAHLVGFTNVDDSGQEGLELAYDNWLRGVPGKREVIKDRLGHVINEIQVLREPQPGHDLQLSIDKRIQYTAFRELQTQVRKFHADSGSVVILDVRSGEVLAMVNQPAYNPNNRPARHDGRYRNRAVTDMFEPGSVMKSFAIASALKSGKYKPDSKIDIRPGWLDIDGNTVRDEHFRFDFLSVTQVLQKSSNVGVTKMILSLPPENLFNLLKKFGFGDVTGSDFPGEVAGSLVKHRVWRPFVLATMAFGYALSVTPLQLARAYGALATDGVLKPVSLVKLDKAPQGVRVLNQKVAALMLTMLESVLKVGGTGHRGVVKGYRVAGKTGTAYIAGPHGYDDKHRNAVFVGIAPVTDPRLVVAVVVRNPHRQHYGGLVAAPVFAKVMSRALQVSKVAPDNLPT